jgi:NAD(P)-dependent dehydrogenase (short-subunit alcohol dehydrogenase family)
MMLRRRSLDGQVVFITGAARGIGEHTARLAIRRGARVALAGLEPERLEALARELGPRAAWFECDVTDTGSLERAANGTVRQFGGIDVVVANAGVGGYASVALSKADALAKVVEVDLIGVMRTVSATLPHVTERKGYLLLVSSAAAFSAMPGMSAYCAAKAGVEQFGNVLRQEVVHKKVAVGVAHPCWIDTDLVREQKRQTPTFEEILGQLPGPLGSYTSVEECATAFIDGMERRRRKIFVPKSLARVAAVRSVILSGVGDLPVRLKSKKYMAQLEKEMSANRPTTEIKPSEQSAGVA